MQCLSKADTKYPWPRLFLATLFIFPQILEQTRDARPHRCHSFKTLSDFRIVGINSKGSGFPTPISGENEKWKKEASVAFRPPDFARAEKEPPTHAAMGAPLTSSGASGNLEGWVRRHKWMPIHPLWPQTKEKK